MTQTQTKETSAVESAQAKIESIQQAVAAGNTKLNAQDLANARAGSNLRNYSNKRRR
jgi:translation initiation factor IF-2